MADSTGLARYIPTGHDQCDDCELAPNFVRMEAPWERERGPGHHPMH